MIVETVSIRNATIRVHDSSYRDKPKEEAEDCVVGFYRAVTDAMLRKEKQQSQ